MPVFENMLQKAPSLTYSKAETEESTLSAQHCVQDEVVLKQNNKKLHVLTKQSLKSKQSKSNKILKFSNRHEHVIYSDCIYI